MARGYAINLFRVYHNSFVKKSIDKYNIPYSMKPMCGDLHNMYKTNKIPISQSSTQNSEVILGSITNNNEVIIGYSYESFPLNIILLNE